ncbi:toll/interleukin-1 receptor domain-containing protein [Desulfovibrio sp. OttesenSCG-928-C06]|nr:toll/interleukin-1 receptor domain-containing protein [Desulfovibrio sp. OttesenSCG-928-C06]
MKYSAFISYSSHDKLFVDALVHRIEMEKIPCWYAPRDIPPGMSWPSAISQAVPNVSIMILVLSESSNYSQEVSKELTLASNNRRLVIPVRISDIQPNDEFKYHLSNRHWLDVYDLEMEAAINKILETLLQHRQFYMNTEGGAENTAPGAAAPGAAATAPRANAHGTTAPSSAKTPRPMHKTVTASPPAPAPIMSLAASNKPEAGRAKRPSPLWLALDSVFLITFNILFFLFQGTENTPSVWISYGFIHFAYFMVLLTPYIAAGGRGSSALSFPLYAVSTVYFLAQLALGIVLIHLNPANHIHTLAPQLVLLAIFAVFLFSTLLANKSSSGNMAESAGHSFIKQLKTDLEIAMKDVADTQKRKLMETVYDDIKASPGKSHASLEPLEKDIAYLAQKLSAMSAAGLEEFREVARDMQNLLEERNKKLRLL